MRDAYDPDPEEDSGPRVVYTARAIGSLMMPAIGPPHWTDRALCEGDDRFTQDEKLGAKDRKQMENICRECEVFFECLEFHDPPDEPDYRAVGVFAAGEYFEEDVAG